MTKGANVTLMVADMDRLVRFYVETLGLKLQSRYRNEFAQVTDPGTTIALHPAKGTASPPDERVSIGFSVDGLDQAMTELKARGTIQTRRKLNC